MAICSRCHTLCRGARYLNIPTGTTHIDYGCPICERKVSRECHGPLNDYGALSIFCEMEKEWEEKYNKEVRSSTNNSCVVCGDKAPFFTETYDPEKKKAYTIYLCEKHQTEIFRAIDKELLFQKTHNQG